METTRVITGAAGAQVFVELFKLPEDGHAYVRIMVGAELEGQPSTKRSIVQEGIAYDAGEFANVAVSPPLAAAGPADAPFVLCGIMNDEMRVGLSIHFTGEARLFVRIDQEVVTL